MAVETNGTEDTTSPTHQLCSWVADMALSKVPADLVTRSKYLLLDGIACALTCAHTPLAEKAARAVFAMEGSVGNAGSCAVIGYPDHKLTPLSAALLNSTFIQGFELDDWHKDAPLHSNSLFFPSMLAATQHRALKGSGIGEGVKSTGADLLLGMIIGYEVGPRVGNALYGRGILSKGWHSGAVFGPAAVASAVSRLHGLSPEAIEDAIGIACTQACGLMSAQFESDVKRMQHGFAARNGLTGALLAKEGYIGIKRVLEREYGGFLEQFSRGNGETPQYKKDEVCKGLGEKWQLEGVVVKPYASMAVTHGAIDCVRELQAEYPELLESSNLSKIKSITIRLEEPAYHHGGWRAERPLESIGGQMSVAFVCATQLVDRQVLAAQFKPDGLESNARWELVQKTTNVLEKDYPTGRTSVEIGFEDGETITKTSDKQRGVDPPLSNEEIKQKYTMLTGQVIDEKRSRKIEDFILSIEEQESLDELVDLLTLTTGNPLA